MHSGLLPSAVLATIAREGVDPERIIAEISTVAKARRYAILRLTTGTTTRVRVVESSLDPQVATYISDQMSDENSALFRKTMASNIPFSWSFAAEPAVRRRASENGGQAWADLAASSVNVFFRCCSAAERLLFVAQSQPGAEPLDTESLFCCHGLTQVVFDQIALRAAKNRAGAPRITQREKECLRWCAEGKTSEEIGIILSLSTHTVNHYLISATKKLNAVNRMHAITIAVRQGILDINDEP